MASPVILKVQLGDSSSFKRLLLSFPSYVSFVQTISPFSSVNSAPLLLPSLQQITEESFDAIIRGCIENHSGNDVPVLRIRVLPEFQPSANYGDKISFSVNGKAYTVDGNAVDPLMSLNEWLRSQPGHAGTKRMCQQGSCGSCTVVLSHNDAQGRTVRVNACSCLKPLYSMDGFEVTTTEGLGSTLKGYSVVQNAIAAGNGSQCGYCTPGFVMAMHGLLANNSGPSAQDVENQFDGNLCRCTGYRPILTAMQSFARKDDEPNEVCEEKKKAYAIPYAAPATPTQPLKLKGSTVTWYRPTTLTDVLAIVAANDAKDVRLVVGNTSTGILPQENTQSIRIDMSFVTELKKIETHSSSVIFGSTVTLTEIVNTLQSHTTYSPTTFPKLIKHILNVANSNLRNVGCWAGNFMIAHDNDNFPSDVAAIMTSVGATVTVMDAATRQPSSFSIIDFMHSDMSKKMLVSLNVPFAGPNERLETFKLNGRRQCSHAYVNAAFRFTFVSSTSSVVADQPSIVFGGIAPKTTRASQTEQFLVGKDLSDQNTFNAALAMLQQEMVPVPEPGRVEYRRGMVASSFYRAVLAMLISESKTVPTSVISASHVLTRPVSTGDSEYSGATWEGPAGQPMVKESSWIQASGQATYTADGPLGQGLLYAQFVTSTQGNAKIDKIDVSAALAIEGVVDFITTEDIPHDGTNMIVSGGAAPTPIFAVGRVQYYGQALGIIVATSQGVADRAAKAVVVSYSDIQGVVTSVKEAIDKQSFFPDAKQFKGKIVTGDVEKAFPVCDKVIEGQLGVGSQYHMHMETQSAIVYPKENNSFKVYSATQYASLTAKNCALILGIPANKIELEVKRLGGAYGGKIFNPIPVAAACTLAAYKLQVPVKITLNLETNMMMLGSRFPYVAKYKVGAKSDGKIEAVQITYYSATGYDSDGQGTIGAVFAALDNCYNIANWKADGKLCMTNTAWHTSARAPGYCQGVLFMEQIIEDVAAAINKDPLVVRSANLYKTGDVTPYGDKLKYCSVGELLAMLQQKADYTNRVNAVNDFNQKNRWVKRGICLMPAKYSMGWNTANYGVLVNINGYDGSVQVNHSGVEMGQGIDVKVAQTVATQLDCPLEYVVVTATNTNVNPNAMCTGGSITSELNCMGAIEACKRLRTRLATQKRLMPRGTAWKDLIAQCFASGMDLSERFFVSPDTNTDFQYTSYIAGVAEVEVDLLTGQYEIIRTDIEFDAGQSINPEVDLGQIQGGFMMGMGWLTCEEMTYDPSNGRLINNSTWDYHVPSSQCIPQDFRVTLWDKAYNPMGVLGAKAVGEPPLCLAPMVFFAIKHAIAQGRKDAGLPTNFEFDAPATVVNVFNSAGVDPKQFSLQ